MTMSLMNIMSKLPSTAIIIVVQDDSHNEDGGDDDGEESSYEEDEQRSQMRELKIQKKENSHRRY